MSDVVFTQTDNFITVDDEDITFNFETVEQTLNFEITGAPGPEGPQGVQGPQGIPGLVILPPVISGGFF